MDPIDTDNEAVQSTRKIISDAVKEKDPSASIHDFRMVSGTDQINLIFDLVLPYSYNKEECRRFTEELKETLKRSDPRFNCVITVEHSYVN
nr:cation-efflux pump [Lachnospiraceae bacterium]